MNMYKKKRARDAAVEFAKRARQQRVEQFNSRTKTMVKRLLLNEMETKFIDLVANNQPVSLSGNTQAISLIQQGLTTGQRVGNHIHPQYIYTRGSVSSNTTGIEAYNFFIAVILDRQPNGALANFSDIYDITIPDAGNALRTIQSTGKRFKVLKRVDIDNICLNGVNCQSWEMYIDLQKALSDSDRDTEYLSNVGTTAGWSTNHYIIAFGCANGTNTVTNTPVCAYTVRLAYKDA